MRMGFYEVTGGRALSFRDVSMGEAAVRLRRKCGGPPARRAYASERAKLPRR